MLLLYLYSISLLSQFKEKSQELLITQKQQSKGWYNGGMKGYIHYDYETLRQVAIERAEIWAEIYNSPFMNSTHLVDENGYVIGCIYWKRDNGIIRNR